MVRPPTAATAMEIVQFRDEILASLLIAVRATKVLLFHSWPD